VYPAGNKALLDINLKIEKGDFVFLVGASGAGKSSFMKLLLREELPTRGQVFVAGKSMNRMKRREVPFLRRNLGMVFQDFRLLNNYTVFENVAFALRVVEAPVRDIPQRVEEVLRLVGLSGKGQTLPERLSGGEQQMLAVARILRTGANLLLLDEISEGLAPVIVQALARMIKALKAKGYTIVMVEQNFRFAAPLADRFYVMEHGQIVEQFDSSELAAKQDVLNTLLGV